MSQSVLVFISHASEKGKKFGLLLNETEASQ
uniref:Uncharacterized protein n=1 Tax=Candidatus Kentrum sp. FW TaxID=2126338 RepID=A0A450T0U2_9GAMM|nr:MAG: hypothetical protein BECKFW1821A_GA0114235_100233 [Candidatus Kentron sp. FW]VFJ60083.1 MAG: hypothetical protein BECKFW1821B_GA0114236_105332 [Candidatus Kentron sp. FW]